MLRPFVSEGVVDFVDECWAAEPGRVTAATRRGPEPVDGLTAGLGLTLMLMVSCTERSGGLSGLMDRDESVIVRCQQWIGFSGAPARAKQSSAIMSVQDRHLANLTLESGFCLELQSIIMSNISFELSPLCKPGQPLPQSKSRAFPS